jgi:hypothetical protein
MIIQPLPIASFKTCLELLQVEVEVEGGTDHVLIAANR